MTIAPLTLAEIALVAGGLSDEEAWARYAYDYDWWTYMTNEQAVRLGVVSPGGGDPNNSGGSHPGDSTVQFPPSPPNQNPWPY